MLTTKSFLAIVAFGLLTSPCWAADTNAAWNNLKHITHGGSYSFVSRGEKCFQGKITEVKDGSIVVKRTSDNGANKPVELLRADVIRIDDGTAGLLYSGRNTWNEVVSLASEEMSGFNVGKGSFLVVTKSGKKLSSRTMKVTASDLTLGEPGHEEKVSKAQVASVGYVRASSWAEGVEWTHQEFGPLAVFDPRYWPHVLHLSGTLTVPVYDASLPENDTAVACTGK